MINSERADNNMRKTNADDVLQIIDDTTKTLEQLGLQNEPIEKYRRLMERFSC